VCCDAAGLAVEVTDPLGHRRTAHRDAFGRVDLVVDALGARTRRWWTVEGQLARVQGPDGAEQSWEYDGEGNCVRHTDAAGGVTTYEYTHFDLLIARTQPDGARYEFAYDPSLRLTKVTAPQGLTWEYTYDPVGRLVAETDFDGRRVTYRRDAAGRAVSRTNPLGQSVTYGYDVMGRLVSKSVDGAITSYAYDSVGRRLRAASVDCEMLWERDASGRTVAETVNGRRLSFRYDATGRRVERTTPVGARAVYGYDASGNTTSLLTSDHVLDFSHDAGGREISRLVDGSLRLSQSWDTAGRPTDQTVTDARGTVQRRAYAFRPDDTLVGIDDPLRGEIGMTLDAVGRVTEVSARDWTETYAYDSAGNQVQAVWPGRHPGRETQGDRGYAGNRLVHAGSVRYEYDAAGRIVTRRKTRLSRTPDVWRYTWDAEDRLTSVTTPDGTVWRYLYDPFGRRTAKQRLAGDGTTVVEETLFTWDGFNLAEQTTTASTLPHPVTLTWDHDGLYPVAQTERLTDRATQEEIDSRFFAIVTDLVGTPTELVDVSGDIAWRSRRTLWGLTTWQADSTAHTPLRFPGQYHDPESGLHYNYHRYYDPETARYCSVDPLGLEPAPNPYGYVPNPYRRIDPFGLSPYQILYHGSDNWQGTQFALNISEEAKRAGTPNAGVYLTDDFTRAATAYGRDGHMVRVKVPKEFAESIFQLGGPNHNQPEFFVNTPEGLEILNNGITEILPTREATGKFFAGLW